MSYTVLDQHDVKWLRANKAEYTMREQADLLDVHWRTVEKARNYHTHKNVTDEGLHLYYGTLVPPGPCMDCPLADRCRQKRIACAEFYCFVERGGAPKALKDAAKAGRKPTQAVYDLIYCGIEKDYIGINTVGNPVYRSPERLINLKLEAIRSLSDKEQ